MCSNFYPKMLPETPIHVQAFPCTAGLMALSDTQSHTNAHIQMCACVDHLLTALRNDSTCLGLRLLFPCKKLTISGLDRNDWLFSFYYYICSFSLGLESSIEFNQKQHLLLQHSIIVVVYMKNILQLIISDSLKPT